MILLDTDVLSIAQHPDSAEARNLHRRILLLPASELVASSIISYYEEQMRGWLAFVAHARTKAAQISAYGKLLRFLADWRSVHVIPFDAPASDEFDRLRASKLRIGSFDLKIAAIALTRGATLISRNLRDFGRVPGLRVEDWTTP